MKLISFFTKPFVVRYKRWNRKTSITKRQQFVIITLLLTGGLIATQSVPPDYRYQMVIGMAALSYLLAAFGLREDLSGIEWYTLLILPVCFTAAVSLFYFLLPIRWLTRIPFAVLFAIGMYALLLTENIYNIAASRTIALLRAAHTVGFLLTLVTFYFLIQTVLALWSFPLVNSLGGFILSMMLSLQTLWAITLEDKLNPKVLHLSLFVAVVVAQMSWIMSFWPVNITIKSLFLTTVFYSAGGLSQQYLQERLYRKTVFEFLSVSAIVFIIVLFATNWRSV